MSQASGNDNNASAHPLLIFQEFFKNGQSMTQGFASFIQKMPQMGLGMTAPELATPKYADIQALQRNFMEQQTLLWKSILEKGQGKETTFRIEPEPGDRRFSAPEWSESPFFDYIRQSYLLNVRFLNDLVETIPAKDQRTRDKLRFAARQYVDALSPSNFAATNPEFIKLAIQTNGKSVTDGVNNMIEDMRKGRISMTDETIFEVGKNLATTEGKVVFENDLIQLIQYKPLTEKVARRPLLVVPPCINKFYIMDLQPENSLVRFMVEQGNTVFLVSWRNPKEEHGKLTWDDYLENGTITAIRVVQEISKQKELNMVGFCVGGTILTSTLAVLAAKGEKPAASLTLLTTLLDFADTGEIGLFIDEPSLAARDAAIGKGGLLKALELQNTFSILRPNDLIWNYVTSNYLKGQKPPAFDLLYWNADSTNLPGPFACWYMRNMYHNNSLRVPGKLEMCGVKVDITKLNIPTYLYASREDHIVPWYSAYQSTQILSGDTRFVLGASGHIAGVINPAAKNRRSYWLNENLKTDADTWLARAEEQKGSWWNDWAVWIKAQNGGEQAAPKTFGNTKYKPIEAAPGRYVKERVV